MSTEKRTVTALTNRAYALAMQQLRSSSAAQRHTPLPRKGTRAAALRRAVREDEN